MKVKCIKIFNVHTNEHQERSSWITIGKEYVVLAIEIRCNAVSFLIISDSNDQPILQDAVQFEVISKKVPSSWQISPGSIELLFIGPKSWSEPGFWEDCYDHEPGALETYKNETRIIMDEEISK